MHTCVWLVFWGAGIRARNFPFLWGHDWMSGIGGHIWNSALSLVWNPELRATDLHPSPSCVPFFSQPRPNWGILEHYHLWGQFIKHLMTACHLNRWVSSSGNFLCLPVQRVLIEMSPVWLHPTPFFFKESIFKFWVFFFFLTNLTWLFLSVCSEMLFSVFSIIVCLMLFSVCSVIFSIYSNAISSTVSAFLPRSLLSVTCLLPV